MLSTIPSQNAEAHVVTLAMVLLSESKLLRDLGYRQVLQVHDEVLLEGPREHAEQALAEVIRLMEDPLPFKLQVHPTSNV